MDVSALCRSCTFLALAAGLLVPLERLWPRAHVTTSWLSLLGDVGWLVASAAALNVVVAPLLAWLASDFADEPEPWRIVVAFVGAEVGAYASHRLAHAVPALWRFHAVHHDVEELTWSKAWRQHPVDVAFHALAVAVPGLCVGVSLTELGAVLLVRRLWTGFLHANVSLRFGVLEHVIATPAFHHAHHDRTRAPGNFAGLLPVLDHMLGSWLPPAERYDGTAGESAR